MIPPYYNRYPYGLYPSSRFTSNPYMKNNYLYDKYEEIKQNSPKNSQSSNSKFDSKNHSFNETVQKDKTDDPKPIFELFGIKLFFDDILLISLIFFLYSEGVKDQSLFISLILLLLS